MKNLQIQQALLRKGLTGVVLLFLIAISPGCRKFTQNPTPKVSTVVSGLETPMGIETDQI